MINIPRVLRLLEGISSELKKVRKEISTKNNPELVGVFDRLLVQIEVQKSELVKEGFSYENPSRITKLIVNLIEFIVKWNDILYYKISRCLAALNKIVLVKNVGRKEYQAL